MNTLRPTLAALAAAALLALSCPGCTITHSEVGRPLTTELQSLVVGQTTKGDAFQLLGAPHSIRRQFDGDLLLWMRWEADGDSLLLLPVVNIYFQSHDESRADRLALLFDERGLLSAIGEERALPAATD